MQTPQKQNRFFVVLDKALDITTAALLVNILLLMSLQIVMRYVFNRPLTWTEEISRYSLVWMTFLGSIIIVRRNEHIFVDFVLGLLPEKLKKISSYLVLALGILFLLVVVYYGSKFAGMNMQNKSLVTGIVKGHVYSVIPFSAALMVIYHIRVWMEGR